MDFYQPAKAAPSFRLAPDFLPDFEYLGSSLACLKELRSCFVSDIKNLMTITYFTSSSLMKEVFTQPTGGLWFIYAGASLIIKEKADDLFKFNRPVHFAVIAAQFVITVRREVDKASEGSHDFLFIFSQSISIYPCRSNKI